MNDFDQKNRAGFTLRGVSSGMIPGVYSGQRLPLRIRDDLLWMILVFRKWSAKESPVEDMACELLYKNYSNNSKVNKK